MIHGQEKVFGRDNAQIARFKEHVRQLEDQVRSLKEENELLYGKLSNTQAKVCPS
jgi:predicted RNase H-like nuclease (RuvC/YqgF family)